MALSVILFAFLAFVTASHGWESRTQYGYEYNGRVVNGIKELDDQWAMAHINGHISVQSLKEDSIIVKFTNGRVQHASDMQGDAYQGWNDETYVAGSSGRWEPIEEMEHLETPFVVNYKFGSVGNIQISADEPLWTVNMKKAIASQLQLDVTGVRATEDLKSNYSSSEEYNTAFNVYEDGVTGDCSTWYQINKLPESHIWSWNQWNTDRPSWWSWDKFESICKDGQFWEITKNKDFDRCITNPTLNWINPPMFRCSLSSSGCGETIQRSSIGKYIACGSKPTDWTVIRSEGFSDFIVQPFALRTEKLINTAMTWLTLKSKEDISSLLSPPSNLKTWESLAYEFSYADDSTKDDSKMPDLTSAWMESTSDTSILKKSILDVLRVVSRELKESTESKMDLPERLVTIRHVLPYFSLDELRSLAQQIKSEDKVAWDLFIDALVTTGTNPTVMLVKELIEKGDIIGMKAIWSVASLAYHVKTPTPELLRELVKMIKSGPVQSNKDLKQTAFLNFADLISAACDSPFYTHKRFPTLYMGDFCSKHEDSFISQEFLPLLSEWLSQSEGKGAEHMMALTALGNLGTADILPILLPHIRGSKSESDPAQRARSVYSLHRVMYSDPERVLPLLTAIADNVAERPEVRIAAISMLFSGTTPTAIWQKMAYRTWFEPSQQVAAFTYSIISSFAAEEEPWHHKIVEKARGVLALAKPWTAGYSWSGSEMISHKISDKDLRVFTHYPSTYHGGERFPVGVVLRQSYQFGPLVVTPVQLYIWNYNMEDIWNKLYERWTGYQSEKSYMPYNSRSNRDFSDLKDIWEQLKPAVRPEDKRTFVLHLNLMGHIHRMIDLEEMLEKAPRYLEEMMGRSGSSGTPVSWAKFGNLAEIDFHFPNELGWKNRFLVQVPVLASVQGNLKFDWSTYSFESNAVARLGFKLWSQLKTKLPWSHQYVGSGVDVRFDVHAPRNFNVKLTKEGQLKAVWNLGNKVNDLLHFHVKPYTVARDWWTTWSTPHIEDKTNTKILSVTDKPFKLDYKLPVYGINLKLSVDSDYPHNDWSAWSEWFEKFDLNALASFFFVPHNLHHREYRLQYLPEGSQTQSVSALFHYFSWWKSGSKSYTYRSGTTSGESKTIQSPSPIPEDFRPVIDRLFKSIDSGNARILLTAVRFLRKDGSTTELISTYGYAHDYINLKSYRDLQVTRGSGGSGSDYALCGFSTRSWNSPPAFGFSSEPLYQTEDGYLQMGPNCGSSGSKVNWKVKFTRDETAATWARNTEAAKNCRQEMKAGLYDSPSCQEARDLDQTFNLYEIDVDVPRLPEYFSAYWTPVYWFVNKYFAPFVVSHKREGTASEGNGRWSLKASREPWSGDVNMRLKTPYSTVEARNVYFSNETWSPMMATVLPAFFPIQSDVTYMDKIKSYATAGISEAQCFVGADRIVTFDSVPYNFTVSKCNHVLVTDCYQNSRFAVLARQVESRKIVQVILQKDTIEIDPSGTVTINGEAKALDTDNRLEIFDGRDITVTVWWTGKGISLELPEIGLELVVRGAQVTVSGPWKLRGRTCGLCGDFDQEKTNEYKTSNGCAVSSGPIMAASYQVRGDSYCSEVPREYSEILNRETENCRSVDERVRSDLPVPDFSKPTKCHVYRKISLPKGPDGWTCESAYPVRLCHPGCKPAYMVEKPIDFKCSGSNAYDIRLPFTVPAGCV